MPYLVLETRRDGIVCLRDWVFGDVLSRVSRLDALTRRSLIYSIVARVRGVKDMVIDWNRIALDEGIEALAEFLRGEWGVWVGLIDHSGFVTPLGDARSELEHPLCACFKANPLNDVASDSLRSCSRTLAEWGDIERPVRGVLPCHAGLQAILSPVMLDGERVATLYASGFISTRDESRQLTEIRQRAHRLAHATEPVNPAWIARICRENLTLKLRRHSNSNAREMKFVNYEYKGYRSTRRNMVLQSMAS